MSAMVRVSLAEDSYLVREGLTRLLESMSNIEVIATCEDRDSLLAAVDKDPPDVVLTDIRMPPSLEDEGIEVAERLRDTHPEVGVLVLSHFSEPKYVLRLFEHGSDRRGYLIKDRIHDRPQLMNAIQEVADGGSVVDPKVVEVLVNAKTQIAKSSLNLLTERELEVLGLIAQGMSNATIADELVLSKGAVEKHINAIFTKLPLPEETEVSRRVVATLLYLSEQGGFQS